jgi:hypothetical protein
LKKVDPGLTTDAYLLCHRVETLVSILVVVASYSFAVAFAAVDVFVGSPYNLVRWRERQQ